MENKNTRYNGLDYLRSFAAFSVVWIHGCSLNEDTEFLNIFNSYAVPVFILTAVFLQCSKPVVNDKNYIFKLFKKLLPQYFFWSFVYFVLRFSKLFLLNNQVFVPNFSDIFLGGMSVQLWFLPALVIWQTLMLFFMKYKNLILDVSLAIISFLLFKFLYQHNFIHSGGFLVRFGMFTGYIFLGKAIAQNITIITLINKSFLRFLVISMVIIKVFMNENMIIDIVYALIIFCFFLKESKKSEGFILSISQNSFGIYLAHFIFIQLMVIILNKLHVEITLLYTILIIVSSFFISYLLSLICKKNIYLSKLI